MTTIFMLYVDTADEGPLMLGFFSTLELAGSRGQKIVDDLLGWGPEDIFIDEYALDQMMLVKAGYGFKQEVDFAQPINVYNYKGAKLQ